ncbi:MAG: phenylacetate--CoA ligase [Syntrophobacteraceae bacterium]|nr:phenylacetate--CoA ligase [Syntrophobacteraceae bacterium]
MAKTDQYWDVVAETIPRFQLDQLQLRKLKQTLKRAVSSEFYGMRLREAGVSPSELSTIEDIRRIPFTTKTDLRSQYPFGMVCVPKDRLVRLHVSSGTTGQATAVLYTRADLDHWANLLARCMYMTGARPGHTFQNLTGYGMFTGGLGFHYGSERIGLLTIPSGAGNSKRQIQLMRDFGTNILHIIPSYALRLMDVLAEMGVDPKTDLELKIAYLGAEPYSEEVRRRVEDFYGIKIYNSYGLSEMNGPGVAFECPFQSGMHVWEDAYVVEIVDPTTLEPVEEGAYGELVLTSLDREAMPILRYRTGDVTRILPGECPCGRVHHRLDRIRGRSDDMFIIKGVNIFPIQVEHVLMNIPEVRNNYVIVLRRENDIDEMVVRVEVTQELFVEDMRHLHRVRDTIVRDLRSELLITPVVELVEPNSLPKNEGKAVRLLDQRTVKKGG